MISKFKTLIAVLTVLITILPVIVEAIEQFQKMTKNKGSHEVKSASKSAV